MSKGTPQYHQGNQAGKDGKKALRRLIFERCMGASTPGVGKLRTGPDNSTPTTAIISSGNKLLT